MDEATFSAYHNMVDPTLYYYTQHGCDSTVHNIYFDEISLSKYT